MLAGLIAAIVARSWHRFPRWGKRTIIAAASMGAALAAPRLVDRGGAGAFECAHAWAGTSAPTATSAAHRDGRGSR